MERYICIHAHFYQPPRENAWLEAVELQDSAYPVSRLERAGHGGVLRAQQRFANSGWRWPHSCRSSTIIPRSASTSVRPCFPGWSKRVPQFIRRFWPPTVRARQLFSGHGSAVAQAYNHMILPLASRQDKYTQILWGIRDFESRFGRHPEGMWLPETAVDLQTLEVLAELGIKFTILSPYQAGRVQAAGRAGLAQSGWRQNRSFHGLCGSRSVRARP